MLIEILKFGFRLLQHLLLLLLICLPLQFIGIIVIPFVLAIIGKATKFPTAFKWFDNADVWVGRDTSTYLSVIDTGFWYRYYWLALRNPLNYFGYTVLGDEVKSIKLLHAYCDAVFKAGEVGDTKHAGFIYTEFLINDKLMYEYYWVKKYNFFGKEKCIRFRMGWKLDVPIVGEWVQEVFVFQIFHDYSGA